MRDPADLVAILRTLARHGLTPTIRLTFDIAESDEDRAAQVRQAAAVLAVLDPHHTSGVVLDPPVSA